MIAPLVVVPLSRYLVHIRYREPSYELRAGRKAFPYAFTFEVAARDEHKARQRALQLFDETARQSSVGWMRQIIDVQVEHAPGLAG